MFSIFAHTPRCWCCSHIISSQKKIVRTIDTAVRAPNTLEWNYVTRQPTGSETDPMETGKIKNKRRKERRKKGVCSILLLCVLCHTAMTTRLRGKDLSQSIITTKLLLFLVNVRRHTLYCCLLGTAVSDEESGETEGRVYTMCILYDTAMTTVVKTAS